MVGPDPAPGVEMTHAIDSTMLAEPVLPPRVDVPRVPGWALSRPRLNDRLDLGVCAALTLVTGPTGWGKTVGVASWASRVAAPGPLVWVTLSGTAGDPDLFWKLLHRGLQAAGQRHLLPIPSSGDSDARRLHALALLGAAMRRSGPWVLVLDDFPTGPVGDLGRDLEVLMNHAHHGLRLVILSHGDPALAVHRHHVAGELTRIGVPDLGLDVHEVAAVLRAHGVLATDLTARTVERHTDGWPCGVRLAASALRDAPTVEAGLDAADRAIVEYLTAEVLAKTPQRVHELLVRTSMVEEVSRDLAVTVLGADAEVVLHDGSVSAEFVDLGSDGVLRCHPLLRAAACAELRRRPGDAARESRRLVARWHLDQGQTSTGLEIALAGQDWSWVARALVESYVVPRILAGSTAGVMRSALEVEGVRGAEPLIEAALLMGQRGADAAETVLDLITQRGAGGGATAADELSAIFVRLAVARARGDACAGLALAPRARELLAHLRIERQRELCTMLEAGVGALELGRGDLARAEVTLRHGAVDVPGEDLMSPARRDCLGQLALLEAFRGNLRHADRQAAAVLTSATPGRCTGVAHAHLATAWGHLERGEHVPARQHLDRVVDVSGDDAEPWLGTAQLLAEATLLVATGHPEAAVRLLVPAVEAVQLTGHGSDWTRGLLTAALARALLVSGEPEQALGLVEQNLGSRPVGLRLVAAQARFALDDLAGARLAIRDLAPDVATSPVATQIEVWLLEARLCDEGGSSDRGRALIDRVLRVAARESMRRPVAAESGWLAPTVEQDPALRRTHGGFLAGLRSSTHALSARSPQPGGAESELIETLTVREAEVLVLLAEMCSTEEIASVLFLSVNTVKTYVRGILRKLSVNRRVDAVRRGRELGLC